MTGGTVSKQGAGGINFFPIWQKLGEKGSLTFDPTRLGTVFKHPAGNLLPTENGFAHPRRAIVIPSGITTYLSDNLQTILETVSLKGERQLAFYYLPGKNIGVRFMGDPECLPVNSRAIEKAIIKEIDANAELKSAMRYIGIGRHRQDVTIKVDTNRDGRIDSLSAYFFTQEFVERSDPYDHF